MTLEDNEFQHVGHPFVMLSLRNENEGQTQQCIFPVERYSMKDTLWNPPRPFLRKTHRLFDAVFHTICPYALLAWAARSARRICLKLTQQLFTAASKLYVMIPSSCIAPVTDPRAVCSAGADLPRWRQVRTSAPVLQARMRSRHEDGGKPPRGRSYCRHPR